MPQGFSAEVDIYIYIFVHFTKDFDFHDTNFSNGKLFLLFFQSTVIMWN